MCLGKTPGDVKSRIQLIDHTGCLQSKSSLLKPLHFFKSVPALSVTQTQSLLTLQIETGVTEEEHCSLCSETSYLTGRHQSHLR